MANIVIVTNQCYLICEAINYITMNETPEKSDDSFWDNGKRRYKRKKPKTQKELQDYIKNELPHQIVIDFIAMAHGPQSNSSRNNDNNSSVTIHVKGRDRCLALYQEMVSQIREQLPDQVYLDKMVERFLTSYNETKQT